MPPGDVTAVVLSIGEPFVARALASLDRQTQPPAEVVRVDGVTPFHRALNAGIARVRTEFFAHVDADMVLDSTALADLRTCAAARIGVVVGGLRDPLRGSIVGVKLFRTAAAAAQPCPDSITPAVDLVTAMRANGWMSAHALAYRPGPPALWHTFGEHQPDYSPLYTFTKFRVLGARYRHQRNGPSARRLFAVLQASRHPAASLARAGAAVGLFWSESRDALRPCTPDNDFERLHRLLDAPAQPTRVAAAAPPQAFLEAYRAGYEAARDGDAGRFRGRFDAFAAASTAAAWAAQIGLCRGALQDTCDAHGAAADFAALNALFPLGLDE